MSENLENLLIATGSLFYTPGRGSRRGRTTALGIIAGTILFIMMAVVVFQKLFPEIWEDKLRDEEKTFARQIAWVASRMQKSTAALGEAASERGGRCSSRGGTGSRRGDLRRETQVGRQQGEALRP